MPTSTMCVCGENQQLTEDVHADNHFVPHVNPRTGQQCAGLPNALRRQRPDQEQTIIQRQHDRIMLLTAQRDAVLQLIKTVEYALAQPMATNHPAAGHPDAAAAWIIIPTYEELIGDIRAIFAETNLRIVTTTTAVTAMLTEANGDPEIAAKLASTMLPTNERDSVCTRCGKLTGNTNQGHYWSRCKVSHKDEVFHFCCPGACELHHPPLEPYQERPT